ncbi:hypothetical protein L4D09_03290 [Photobacterium makurazakiensis]|uniref:hypothetical protein n=1 Tax=Photobacterium makurazakiensis TaxID=2910234 RepID=UPI003D105BE4
MKKLAAFCAALMLSASFSVSAYTLAGTATEIPDGALKYCATSKNFWVCVNNYKQMHK